ncbi:siderophore-interacting protein [Streptomyces sp. NPDC006879]|uniref:siderophore-interacting protein n=1 Tax=Streptomyces sp. NPDC006879 TaxID=3364767 RepID=UPI0036AE0F95
MTVTAPAPATVEFQFFTFEVLRTRRMGHSFLRITFGGESLGEFRSGGLDQSLSLFLPPPHRAHTQLPTTGEGTWFAAWRAMPQEERPAMRSYTVRAQRRTPAGGVEVDIDFVLHGSSPASGWAARATPGQRITAIGPTTAKNRSVRFQPPADSDLLVLYADESALPAATAILEQLPPGTQVQAVFQVPHAEDRLPLRTAALAEIHWLVCSDVNPARVEQARSALRELDLPPAKAPYAWVAGEAGAVRTVRRELVRGHGIDRRRVRFTGYWRLGVSEEELLAQARAGRAPSEDPDSAL